MAGGNNIARMSPRQKMINLMYIVLTAMLALNVSGDVLNGFRQVHEGLDRSNGSVEARNGVQFARLEELYARNPAKAADSYAKGKRLHTESQVLFSTIDSLKAAIARRADGAEADFNDLRNGEDLRAAPEEMLDPVTRRGEHLRRSIEGYRSYVASLITDSLKRDAMTRMLSTESGRRPETPGSLSWEERMFGNMPAVAAITLLTKMQNDIRQAESEAMSALITAVDIGDVRVNELDAYVIPASGVVMRGAKYTANVVLAAIDTTQRPSVFVGGRPLGNDRGYLELPASAPGRHEYSGYIEVAGADGTTVRREFSSAYTVIEPMATISPTMMNVLYAGIDNPISISVPGVPMGDVQATMTNGTLSRSGNRWTARPGKVGTEAVISVSARLDGHTQTVGSMTFRVRKLPDPSPFITVMDAQGNPTRYRGAPKKISKAALMASDGLGAAIDDDLLDVKYSVVSFSTVFFDSMGNAMPEVSDGASFSPRQKEQFRRLRPGRTFFISEVKAKGPDGITRDIPPMQVSVY